MTSAVKPVPYTFVSVNLRNNIKMWARASLFRRFTNTNVHVYMGNFPQNSLYGYFCSVDAVVAGRKHLEIDDDVRHGSVTCTRILMTSSTPTLSSPQNAPCVAVETWTTAKLSDLIYLGSDSTGSIFNGFVVEFTTQSQLYVSSRRSLSLTSQMDSVTRK